MLENVSKERLIDLLRATVDGIDGYESETGYLRYWDSEKVSQARTILADLDKHSPEERRPD